ncbi:MAG: BlaI/MecI/CopY family transcriptional regulator [Bacteroidota bacterium]
MEKLTKKEEEIMNLIWKLKRALVKDIIAELPKPHPPHSTVSSVVRILEKKDFVSHETYGKTHLYFPKVSKLNYRKRTFKDLMEKYFDGSYKQLVSFMVQEELNEQEAEELKKHLQQQLKKKKS